MGLRKTALTFRNSHEKGYRSYLWGISSQKLSKSSIKQKMILCLLSWAVIRAESETSSYKYRGQGGVGWGIHWHPLELQGPQLLPRTRSGPEIWVKMASFPYIIMMSLPHPSEELVCMLHTCMCMWVGCVYNGDGGDERVYTLIWNWVEVQVFQKEEPEGTEGLTAMWACAKYSHQRGSASNCACSVCAKVFPNGCDMGFASELLDS